MRSLLLAAVLVLASVATAHAGWTDWFTLKYQATDAYGRRYEPWNANPYAIKTHWLDRYILYDSIEEVERMKMWQRANPPTSWQDRWQR